MWHKHHSTLQTESQTDFSLHPESVLFHLDEQFNRKFDSSKNDSCICVIFSCRNSFSNCMTEHWMKARRSEGGTRHPDHRRLNIDFPSALSTVFVPHA